MPRGGMKIIPPKPPKAEASPGLRVPGLPSMATKSSRSVQWKKGLAAASFLSKTASDAKAVEIKVEEVVISENEVVESKSVVESRTDVLGDSSVEQLLEEKVTSVEVSSIIVEESLAPDASRPSSSLSTHDDSHWDESQDTVDEMNATDTFQPRPSSTYSRDSTSIYSRDSTSIYSSAASVHSSASSVYSSGASTYSCDDLEPAPAQFIRRASTVSTISGREPLDPAARERSTLAKKAALFKNSKLQPDLPAYITTLSSWSLICRAACASNDCYDNAALTRRGRYTPADSSKDIKAMIIDDQLIDGARYIIVAIRGTQVKSLSDWTVNKNSAPAPPTGFLDDEDNGCHAGFLQVTKAMITQVAQQLSEQINASPTTPSLLFTGHSAGGAVAAMLYSHMHATTLTTPLTALAPSFPSISCITFGAPPLSLTPLPAHPTTGGTFLSLANEGDPVTRLSNAAYIKSLWKLMTVTPPQTVQPALAAPIKTVRRSRGNAIVRQVYKEAPVTPWEELPLWETPRSPLVIAGAVVMLREGSAGEGAVAARVEAEELADVIWADLGAHSMDTYLRRVRELAIEAVMGRAGV